MITHDVDEALLLADKILLMTNGPKARIAEIVENTLPKERTRAELHKLPNYYPLRNHLIEFLVTRSRELALAPEPASAGAPPPTRRPPNRQRSAPMHRRPLSPNRPRKRRRVLAAMRPRLRGVSARELPARAAPGACCCARTARQTRRQPFRLHTTLQAKEEMPMRREAADREDPRHQAREGLDLEADHRRDRRHVAGAGGRRAARPDEARQAAGEEGGGPVRPLAQPRSACSTRCPTAARPCRRPTR